MKKFLVFVLVCIVTTGAFAQFHWDLIMDFNSDAIRTVRPTGDAAVQFFTFEGSTDKIPNTGATDRLPINPFLAETMTPGSYPGSYTSGSTSVFGHQGADGWTFENQLRMRLNGSGENVAWLARISMDQLVGSGGTMVTGAGRPSGLQQLLFTQIIDQWWVRGNAGMFTAWVGIDENGRGSTDTGRFQDFSDVTRGVNIENFGIMIPNGLNPNIVNNGSDHNNFVIAHELTNVHGNTLFTVPVIVVSARLSDAISALPFPFTIDLALDPGRNSGLSGNPRNALTVNAGARISGENVADMFNFDLIYQLRGNDPNTLENVVMGDDGNPLPGFDQNQPDGRGIFVHALGAYTHFSSLLPELGLSLGYSALFRTFEDNANTWADDAWYTSRTRSPLFSGIDFRIRYTGIQDLRITFNNNVSFARAKEGAWDVVTDRLAERAMGLGGTPMVTTIDQLESQAWFGLYNALAVRYSITPQFNLSVQAASRLGKTTVEYMYRNLTEGDLLTVERSSYNLSAAVLASYQFNMFVLIEAGVSMRIFNNTWERGVHGNVSETSLATRNSWNSGSFGFSLPVRMRVLF